MNYQGLFLWLSPLAVLLLFSSAAAQGVCVIEPIKVSAVSGLVLLPNKIPIPDAIIELRKENGNGTLIARTKTDKSGHFKFEGTPKGRYEVLAAYPTLVNLQVPTRVTPSRSGKTKSREIVIILNGLIDQPCGGGDAYGQEKETTRPTKDKR